MHTQAERRAAWGVFLAALVVYVAGLAPSPYWLDSSELAAASATLGVGHPPGEPLALLVGKACALLPLGDVALRVGLASAIAGAAAAALVVLLALRLVRAAAPALSPSVSALIAAAAGVAYAGAPGAAMQAVRPEVYALNTLTTVAAALAIARFLDEPERGGRRARDLGLACLALGLGLANHHLLTLLFGAGALPFVLHALLRSPRPSLPRLARAVLLGATLLALGLTLYAWLPLRASRHPRFDWGAPTTLARFVWVVTARAFQKSLAHASSGTSLEVLARIAVELGLLGPFALGALWIAARRGATSTGRRTIGLLAAAAAMVALALVLVGFDEQNPDALGYLEPSVALLAPLGSASIAALLDGLTRRAPAERARRVQRWGGAAALVVTSLLATAGVRAASLGGFHDQARLVAAALAEVPSRALVLTAYFQTDFALGYAASVEGRRPDVTLLHPHYLPYPGYREEALRRAPALAPLLAAALERGSLSVARSFAERGAPVLVEPDVDEASSCCVAPGLLLDRVGDVDAASYASSARAALARRRALELDEEEPQTRRFLLWKDYVQATRDCDRRDDAAARVGLAEIADARRLTRIAGDGDDVALAELAARCTPLAYGTHEERPLGDFPRRDTADVLRRAKRGW